MKKIIIALLISFIGLTQAASADPTVSQFALSPTSVGNGYSFSVSWNIDSSAGGDLLFSCPLGVTLTTTEGASVACGSRITLSTAVGSQGYKIINVSGSTRILTATLYPKDQSNVLFDSLFTTSSLTVTTAAQPLGDFTISSSSISSGSATTLTWQGLDIPGTMITFDCADSVRLYKDSSTTQLPCNTEVQTADLAVSGTFTFTPQNTSPYVRTLTATLRPAIAAGIYDATHSKTVTFSVQGAPVLPDPSVTSFVASVTPRATTSSVTLTWTTAGMNATALQMQCVSGISVMSPATSTETLPCNTPALSSLSTSGSTTLTVRNSDLYARPILITLLPQTSDGTYLAPQGRTISVSIPAITTAAPVTVTTPYVAPTASTTAVTSTGKMHAPFTRYLKRGMKTPDVLRLQGFLALNAALYPEASVTGLFGPATERAVQRFQEKYNIAKKGVEGYGTVGPATRAKLNALVTP